MTANPGGELQPDQILGRDLFIDGFWKILEGQSVLLVSERRFGKTSVINKMKASPRDGWRIIRRDVEGIGSRQEFAERVFRDAEEHLSKGQRVLAKARGLLGAMGGTEIGGVIKLPPSDAIPWKDLIEKVFEDLSEAPEPRSIFVWDELPFMIQKIHQREGAPAAMEVLDTLRGIRQTFGHARMVFCGSIGMHHVANALRAEGHTNPSLNDLHILTLAPLGVEDAIDLAAQLIRGEKLVCGEFSETALALARAVDCVPYYIHSVIKDLAVKRDHATAATVVAAVDRCLVDPHDGWHLRHFDERLAEYYGKEAPLARCVLDTLASAATALSLRQIHQAASAVKAMPEDLQPLRALLTSLAQDHYVHQEPGTGHYVFHFPLVRKWWTIHRGLV